MLWFRPRIEIFWRIVATVILALYAWFFYDQIVSGYNSFMSGWYVFLVNFLKELLALVFASLLIIWPISLIVIFYKSDEIGAERLLKFLCILTLVLWIVVIIYVLFSRGIDNFLFDNLRKMVPGAE